MIDVETERLMSNWVRWLTSSPMGLAAAQAYELAADRGWAQDTPLPLINSDAEEVERAVKQLDEPLRQAIVEYWLYSEPALKKAHRCRCSVATFWRRLDRAHEGVHTFRRQRRELEERARQAYKSGAPLCF